MEAILKAWKKINRANITFAEPEEVEKIKEHERVRATDRQWIEEKHGKKFLVTETTEKTLIFKRVD